MNRYRRAIALLVLSLGACIKHGRYHPQTGPAPVQSLAPGQRLAIASMVGKVLDDLPNAHVVACVFFRKLEQGYYYAYSPDTSLLGMLWGHHRSVGPDQCPPTRMGGFRVFDPSEPKLPPGYADPYGIRIESQRYARNEAAATIVVTQSGFESTNQCTARRVSHNNWLAGCRVVSQVILSSEPRRDYLDHRRLSSAPADDGNATSEPPRSRARLAHLR